MTTDRFIAWGFWSQLVLLALVDWGTLSSFSRGEGSWIHYVGFAVVNAVLLALTYLVWRWMRQRVHDIEASEPERHTES